MKRLININENEEFPESDGYDTPDTDKEKETNAKPPKKKKKYDQKFQRSWLTDDLFKDWLEKRDEAPYCKICKTSLSCARTALLRHKDSHTHKNTSKMVSNLLQSHRPITALLGSQIKTAGIEIKLCTFIAENNLPISIAEDLVALLRNLFSSDESLRNVHLGKQKATNVIRQVLGFYSIKEIITKLKTNAFSLIIDETTDR